MTEQSGDAPRCKDCQEPQSDGARSLSAFARRQAQAMGLCGYCYRHRAEIAPVEDQIRRSHLPWEQPQ